MSQSLIKEIKEFVCSREDSGVCVVQGGWLIPATGCRRAG